MDTALQMHPAAPPHLPIFITAPGQPDVLMTVMAVFMAIAVVSLGLVYLSLHALPEQMAHRTNKVQLQFVAVLALLALFTHNHVFWIAALLLALVELPDFNRPLSSIARSLERMSGREGHDSADMVSDDTPPPLPAPGAHTVKEG